MSDLILLSSVEYGNYISPVKLVIFLILFLAWLPLVPWVYWDARAVKARETFWTALIFGAGVAAIVIWLVIPFFIVGMLLSLITIGATLFSYAKHRDSKVKEFDRVLTVDYFKGLFVNEQKKLDTLKDLVFVGADKTEAHIPQPKTTEFFGYKTAHDIFADAIWRRASDVILSPTQQNYNVTYRIDGTASQQPAVAKDQAEYLIRFVKKLAGLDINEKRKPQKGRIKTRQGEKYTDWEAVTAGSTTGEQIQLKQAVRQDIARLTDIGLVPEQYEQLNRVCETKQGILIVSGPKKSGVTTTFYSMLKKHDPYLNTVNTLERETSEQLTNITQNVFSLSDTGTTTYAKKLQAIIRMGADVIGVADCRDAETAQTACNAARTAKTFYVTLEADNVIQTLGSWIRLVGDKTAVADTLIGISNQRLLRKLCTECRQAYEPNKELLKKFNISSEKAKVLYRAPKEQVDKHGKPIICRNCQGTGFVGRVPIFEIIIINDELRTVIKQSKSLSEINTEFRRAKMLYLQEQALRKVIDGTTAINEIVRVLSTDKKEKA
jgi:type II secretory ATPase GspE/PulE/Tfp pilus assembly ATPase PilB-like protein